MIAPQCRARPSLAGYKHQGIGDRRAEARRRRRKIFHLRAEATDKATGVRLRNASVHNLDLDRRQSCAGADHFISERADVKSAKKNPPVGGFSSLKLGWPLRGGQRSSLPKLAFAWGSAGGALSLLGVCNAIILNAILKALLKFSAPGGRERPQSDHGTM